MKFEIIPYVSAGPAKLGMSRDEIRSLFEEEADSFKKGEDENETDYFQSIGLFIFYGDDYKCIAIEMKTPAAPSFKDENLLNLDFSQAVRFFADDENLDQDDSGYTSFKYGIGAYYEDIEDEKAETVICFVEGYYSELSN